MYLNYDPDDTEPNAYDDRTDKTDDWFELDEDLAHTTHFGPGKGFERGDY